MSIRVILAEDDFLVREGVRRVLDSTPDDRSGIVNAVRHVAAGGSAFDAKVIDELVRARAADAAPLRTITAREREVLAEVAQGKSNAAIADSLVLTKSAVEKHINSIFGKLGLTGAHDISQRVKATLMFLDDRA